MVDTDPQQSNRQMIEQLKQTVFGKLPITVILLAATCVRDDFNKRMVRANEYIEQVIKTGNEASKTLFGITAEIIQEEKVYDLYGGQPPTMEDMGEILHQGLQQLLEAIEAGLFTREDIIELVDHLYRLAHRVMHPESDSPDKHESVQIALAAMDKMCEAVANPEGKNVETNGKGVPEAVIKRVDLVLNNAVDSLKSGIDPIIPFAMAWDRSDERMIQRSLERLCDHRGHAL